MTQKTKEWFEKEDFWLNYGPVMFDANRWAEAKGTAEGCIELGHFKKGSSILDACCGPGRISVELALMGMNVTGVDITQPYLEMAEETAQDENVKLNLINCDMRTFSSAEKFDGAVNIYNSFGYCSTIEDDMKIIRSISDSLKKGSRFVLECISRETAALAFTEGEWFERDGMTVLTQFSIKGAWEGLNSRWILILKDGKRIEHKFTQRLYSAPQLRDLILANGFSSAEVFGGFKGTPYNHTAKTMVIVAVK